MPQPTRKTNEEIIAAYKETGNIWKAAKRLGLCGQSVWERLKRLGYQMNSAKWNQDEIEELRTIVNQCTLSEAASRLGRSYASVASMASIHGMTTRYGNRQRSKKSARGLDDAQIESAIVSLKTYSVAVTPLSRTMGLDVEVLVQAIQRADMDFWKEYSKACGSGRSICTYCDAEFYGMNKKQKTCSRKCAANARADKGYFGGNRKNTVGLDEGICQICKEAKDRLSSHHVLGKENDPDNEHLAAVCNSCHQVVGLLAAKGFVDTDEGWENLIHFVMARKMREKNPAYAGIYASVEVEHLFADEVTIQ